jgi:hypothetical protein
MVISAMLPTVDAEIGGNVVLPISAKQHPFNDHDLSVIQCHVGLSLSLYARWSRDLANMPQLGAQPSVRETFTHRFLVSRRL